MNSKRAPRTAPAPDAPPPEPVDPLPSSFDHLTAAFLVSIDSRDGDTALDWPAGPMQDLLRHEKLNPNGPLVNIAKVGPALYSRAAIESVINRPLRWEDLDRAHRRLGLAEHGRFPRP